MPAMQNAHSLTTVFIVPKEGCIFMGRRDLTDTLNITKTPVLKIPVFKTATFHILVVTRHFVIKANF